MTKGTIMLGSGAEVFLQLGLEDDANSQARMYPARVVAWSENLVTAAFTDQEIPVTAGAVAWLCYNWNGQFLRRAVRVDAVMDGMDRRTVGLQLTSDAATVDRRESSRACTAILGISVDVDREIECPLLDVSAHGFAAVASVVLEEGQTADVSLVFNNRRYSGQARVRSAREITPGHYRYGMYCLINRVAGGDLSEGLRRVRDAVMRRQNHRAGA